MHVKIYIYIYMTMTSNIKSLHFRSNNKCNLLNKPRKAQDQKSYSQLINKMFEIFEHYSDMTFVKYLQACGNKTNNTKQATSNEQRATSNNFYDHPTRSFFCSSRLLAPFGPQSLTFSLSLPSTGFSTYQKYGHIK